ncbi:uncharacterized protein YALI1_D12135g [Yarrowia lipolytica]|jgi:hypothetical protein|uniref:Uncharacterized protein n=1 Tax=Yarrowia lipolytica TaxID=4952 RepID=A0A1D8NDY2_YARLL|nr:hypothetical protein YALI1_D12135g [Yarrowia lipolytica]
MLWLSLLFGLNGNWLASALWPWLLRLSSALAFGHLWHLWTHWHCSGEWLLLPFRTYWLINCDPALIAVLDSLALGFALIWRLLLLSGLTGSGRCSYCSLDLVAMLLGGSGIRSHSGISALVTGVTAQALLWLWLALIASVGLIGSYSGICCSFDHIYGVCQSRSLL